MTPAEREEMFVWGKMAERDRIIEMLVPIAGKCHLCDYDAANVVELIRGEKMADPVSEPAHYKHPSGIEAIQITAYESFLRGNILKYVLRAPYKGTELQDLKKAEQYLRWEIARIEALLEDAPSS